MNLLLPLEVQRAVGAMRTARAVLKQEFDLSLAKQSKVLSCHPGCAHCCSWPVAISILEGIDLCLYLIQTSSWTNSFREKVQEVADDLTGLTYPVWLNSASPCLFLDASSRCSVYEHRPFACRMSAATGVIAFCHPCEVARSRTIVPRTMFSMAFHSIEESLLQDHRLKMHTMPIATALLAAEPIALGKMELWQADTSIFAEHLERI